METRKGYQQRFCRIILLSAAVASWSLHFFFYDGLFFTSSSSFFIGEANQESATGHANISTSSSIKSNAEEETTTTMKSLFEENWESQWRDMLCPNQRPNLALYKRVILDLVNKELNFTTSTGQLKGMATSDGFYNGYFTPNTKGERYEIVSTPNSSLLIDNSNNDSRNVATLSSPSYIYDYVSIWKCGNNQIREWGQKTFKLMEKYKAGVQADCTITAVRDPISHFLSGYNEIESRWLDDKEKPPCFSTTWKDSEGRSLRYLNHEAGSKQRFEEFVKDTIRNPTTRKHWAFMHILPMSRVLSKTRVDAYLPTIANLTYQWPKFVGKHCPGVPENVAARPMDFFGQHESSNDPHGTYRASKEVWKDQGTTARVLCLIVAIEYACWPDLPDGVPPVCQEVYSSDTFAKAMSTSR